MDKVKEAWIKKIQKKLSVIGIMSDQLDNYSLSLISDYKLALKEAIEKRMDKFHISDQEMDGAKYHECLHILKLLDEVLPPK